MGECNYYGKVQFKRNDDAIKGLELITQFFEQGVKAYEWWQAHRSDTNKTTFWKNFEWSFPMVADCIKTQTNVWGKDHNNALAGLLDFTTESIEREEGGRVVTFYGTVWHCADWTHIMAYIKKNFNADKVGWISEEYTNPFEEIKLK